MDGRSGGQHSYTPPTVTVEICPSGIRDIGALTTAPGREGTLINC
jgi:hypothetical protein